MWAKGWRRKRLDNSISVSNSSLDKSVVGHGSSLRISGNGQVEQTLERLIAQVQSIPSHDELGPRRRELIEAVEISRAPHLDHAQRTAALDRVKVLAGAASTSAVGGAIVVLAEQALRNL